MKFQSQITPPSQYSKTALGLLGFLLSLSLSVHSLNPVASVNLRTSKPSNPSQLPTIQVASNGNQYTHILTRQISIPVEFNAKCSGQHTLMRSQLGVGKLPIYEGHMSESIPPHSEVFRSDNQKTLPWRKHVFKIVLQRSDKFANIDPVKACNDFLNKKLQQGINRSFFMQKDRKMTMNYEISFGAECKRKWKAEGRWRQVSQPAQAVIVCKANR